MQTEFEVKFFVEIEKIQQKLEHLPAQKVRSRDLMRRYVFEVSGMNHQSWLRVRDEGEYVTLTLKSFDSNALLDIESVKELEVKVSDFDTTVTMLEMLGYRKSLYVENYREVWQLKDCQITIDEWPGLQPIVEIEGPSKDSVEAVVALLRFNMLDGMFGPNRLIYQRIYGVSFEEFKATKELTFQCFPEWMKKSN